MGLAFVSDEWAQPLAPEGQRTRPITQEVRPWEEIITMPSNTFFERVKCEFGKRYYWHAISEVTEKHKNAENNSGKCSMFWANNYQGGDKGPELQRLTTGFTGRPRWIRTQGALPNMQSGKNDAWQQWPMACQFSLERHVLNGPRFCFRWVGTTTCTGRSEDAYNHSRSQTVGGNNHHAFQHILWTCKM